MQSHSHFSSLANDKPGIDDGNIGDLIEKIVGGFFY
jgi:hypothetical protein